MISIKPVGRIAAFTHDKYINKVLILKQVVSDSLTALTTRMQPTCF